MKRFTLAKKIILAFLIVAIPISVLLFVSTSYSMRQTREQVSMSNRNLLITYMRQIDTSLDSVSQYLYKTISTIPIISDDYKSSNQSAYIYSLYEINQQLVKDIYTYPYLNALFVYVSDKDQLIATPTTEAQTVDILQNGFLKELIQKGNNIPWTVFSGDTPVLVRMIHLSQNIYIGAYLEIGNIMPEGMKFEEDTKIAITDQDNHVLAGDNQIGGLMPLKQSGNKNDIYSVNTNADNSNKKYILTEAASASSPLLLKLAVPEERMLNSLVNLQKFNYMAIILIAVVLSVYVILLRRAVIRPVSQISKAMKHISTGDWETRLPVNMGEEFNHIALGFNDMVEHIHLLKISMYDEKIKAQKAEYKQLQMQINPHFYMNVLNIIYNMAALKEYENIKKMSLYLSRHFKYIINSTDRLARLNDEIDHTKNYLEINRFRFGETLTYVFSVSPAANSCYIPMLTIQTFIENSIIHGFVERNKPFVISVDIHPWPKDGQEYYEIIIKDTGIGFQKEFIKDFYSEDYVNQSDEHIGIRNIVARLKFRYSGLAKLDLANNEDGGAVVRIVLPQNPE